nr:zinc dependent phospholipase C family protein [Priestia taiwanensis]
MHGIIANKILQQIEIEDREAFLLGALAPDASSNKDVSHFFAGDHSDYTRTIDFEGFLQKYDAYKHHAYVLGYYTHLIADEVWLSGFYLPWLKQRMEVDSDIHKRYHRDFSLLNGKLLEHYGCKEELLQLMYKVRGTVDLEEVSREELERLIPHVRKGMEYDEGMVNEELNVFTLAQIIGYVETSVQKGCFYIGKHALIRI